MDLKVIIRSEVKSDKHVVSHMWNLKNDTNELVYKTDRLADFATKCVVTKGDRMCGGKDGLGVWEWQRHIFA